LEHKDTAPQLLGRYIYVPNPIRVGERQIMPTP
jgi:hypothetical protein